MQVSRRFLRLVPLLILAVAAILGSGARADPSYVEAVLANTSAHVDYLIPSGVQATVGEEAAVATARRYANAPSSAVAHSARLAVYSDLADHNVLVWVIDLEGMSRAAHHAFTATPVPARIITREVWMISASEPGKAVASFASLPALK